MLNDHIELINGLIETNNDDNPGLPKKDVSKLVGNDIAIAYKYVKAYSEIMQKFKLLSENLINKLVKNRELLERLEHTKCAIMHQCEGRVLYKLSDCCYAKAVIKVSDKVCLWLGSNILMEYTTDEAIKVLERNLANLNESIMRNKKEIKYVNSEASVCEVTLSRLHNYSIYLKQTFEAHNAKLASTNA